MHMDDARCGQCRHYAPLRTPFRYGESGYPDDVTGYGFCTKNTVFRSSFYPVYLPDGGQCKDFEYIQRIVEPTREKTSG